MSEDMLVSMPEYQCHKKVKALKITAVQPTENGAKLLHDEPGFIATIVSTEYINKHQPQAGGYYVCYKDGYKSYSPAKEFEEGYTRINN